MLTGTPLDLTPFGWVVQAIGFVPWILAALGLMLALRGSASWKIKLLRAIPVVLLLFSFPAWISWRQFNAEREIRSGLRTRVESAMAMFENRCESAGEKIVRVAENVDGIVWKWRLSKSHDDFDQFSRHDPYGSDCQDEECITNLLSAREGAALNPDEAARHEPGYQFVETLDPRDGQRYRYSARIEQAWTRAALERHKSEKGGDAPPYSYQFKVSRVPIAEFSARYGVTWEDLSTREDRDHWIAGGSLTILDRLSSEVLAKRVGYMVDKGQGEQGGFRSPWLEAVQTACPEFSRYPGDSRRGRAWRGTTRYVSTVLHPKKV